MLTHDEVSGAVILAGRTDRGAVVLVAEFFRSGIVFVDINADKSKSSNDEVYTWLAANAHNYGFILRYPQGKQEIKGQAMSHGIIDM